MRDILKQEINVGDLIITNIDYNYPQMALMTGFTKGGKIQFVSFTLYRGEFKKYNHYANKVVKVTEQQMKNFAKEEECSYPFMRHSEKAEKLLTLKRNSYQ